MSIKALNHVLENTTSLSPSVKLVHLAIANCVNDAHEEEFYASVATLQRQTGLARSTVQGALAMLVDSGHLDLLKEVPGRPTRYQFIYRWGPKDLAEHEAAGTWRKEPARESGTPLPEDQAPPARPAGTNSIESKSELNLGEKSIAQQLYDALCVACKINQEEVTKSLRGELNKAISELKKVDGSPREVLRRSVMYRSKFPNAAVTPSALAKHWATLGPPVDSNVRELYPDREPVEYVGAQEVSPEEKERGQTRLRELSERFRSERT